MVGWRLMLGTSSRWWQARAVCVWAGGCRRTVLVGTLRARTAAIALIRARRMFRGFRLIGEIQIRPYTHYDKPWPDA